MNRTTGMRKISLIVIHCSATREDKELTAFDLDTMHRRRGFNGTGYHYYIRKDCRGRPADTRTPEQRAALRLLVHQLQAKFPGCRVCGHRDLSPDRNGNGEIEPEEWIKACPCFEVKEESFQEQPSI